MSNVVPSCQRGIANIQSELLLLHQDSMTVKTPLRI